MRGFTLIELLVVIAIIGMLSSVVLASLNTARAKSKDARRIADMKQISIALELYFDSNRAYPSTSGAWRSQCAGWGSYTANNVIPGLTPTFIPAIPSDPDMSVPVNTCCYLYQSNGTNFKFLAYNCPSAAYTSQVQLYDPARDGGSNACLIDGSSPSSWSIHSPGGCSW